MMSMCRNVTFNDVKHMIGMRGNALDVLAAVAGKAEEIYQAAILEKGKAPAIFIHHDGDNDYYSAPAPARFKKRKINYHTHHDGEASTSCTITKKRRRNYINLNININVVDEPPAPLPEEFLEKMEEMARGKPLTPATLVIEKTLFETDLTTGHNRLSIPMNKIVTKDFLTKEEVEYYKRYYHDGQRSKKQYKEVRMITPSLEVETAHFCRWDMNKSNGGKTSSSYIINKNWASIAKKNHLREGMKVQLWSFRVDDDELCFALVRIPRN